MLSGQANAIRTTRIGTVGGALVVALLATGCAASPDTAAKGGLAASLTAAGPKATGSAPVSASPSHAVNRTTTGRTNTARKTSTAGSTAAGNTALTGSASVSPGQYGVARAATRSVVLGADTAAAGAVVGLVNAARRSAGCPALVPNKVLAAVALAHSQDMAKARYFDHVSKDGQTPFDRMKKAGYVFDNAAENIAAGQGSATEVMSSWMHSKGHRANILDCSLTQIGVGVYRDPASPYRVYWTQNFGTPA